eukprot:12281143-Alexandrium_andersonii.AAC.1
MASFRQAEGEAEPLRAVARGERPTADASAARCSCQRCLCRHANARARRCRIWRNDKGRRALRRRFS